MDPKVDAIVVGAGAGGGIAAKELAIAGLKVVLLEKGRWYTAWDCRKDDLRNQRTNFLGNAFGYLCVRITDSRTCARQRSGNQWPELLLE